MQTIDFIITRYTLHNDFFNTLIIAITLYWRMLVFITTLRPPLQLPFKQSVDTKLLTRLLTNSHTFVTLVKTSYRTKCYLPTL